MSTAYSGQVPIKHESSRWKCMLLFGTFRIGHTTFRWFPKMYFRFPRHHVNICGSDVTELYMAISSPRRPWQCLKSAWPYLLQFWRYWGKSGLGHFTPSCRDNRIRVNNLKLLSRQIAFDIIVSCCRSKTTVASPQQHTRKITCSQAIRVQSFSHTISRVHCSTSRLVVHSYSLLVAIAACTHADLWNPPDASI